MFAIKHNSHPKQALLSAQNKNERNRQQIFFFFCLQFLALWAIEFMGIEFVSLKYFLKHGNRFSNQFCPLRLKKQILIGLCTYIVIWKSQKIINV